MDRRQALWQADVAGPERAGMLSGLSAIEAPSLPGMSAFELMAADAASTGVTYNQQPMEQVCGDVRAMEDGTRAHCARYCSECLGPVTVAADQLEPLAFGEVLSRGSREFWQLRRVMQCR